MDQAQRARLDEQQRQRLMVNQMINQRLASSEGLERVVGELARTVDRLTGDLEALNSRIDRLEGRPGK